MKGTLYKTEKGWIVKYWNNDPYYKGSPGSIKQVIEELEVTPMSLSNPELSTYWVDGREVNFVPYHTYNPKHAIILPDGKYENKIPTAEEFIEQTYSFIPFELDQITELMQEFAKLHVEAALKEAAETNYPSIKSNFELVNSKILNSYPLTNIK